MVFLNPSVGGMQVSCIWSTGSIAHVFLVADIFHPIDSQKNGAFLQHRIQGRLLLRSIFWGQICGLKLISMIRVPRKHLIFQVSGNQKNLVGCGIFLRIQKPYPWCKAWTLEVHILEDFFGICLVLPKRWFCYSTRWFKPWPFCVPKRWTLPITFDFGSRKQFWKYNSNQLPMGASSSSSFFILSTLIDFSPGPWTIPQSGIFSNHLSKQHQI